VLVLLVGCDASTAAQLLVSTPTSARAGPKPVAAAAVDILLLLLLLLQALHGHCLLLRAPPAVCGAHKDAAVLAVINGHHGAVIQQVDVAVLWVVVEEEGAGQEGEE
jgi:hypothetical protein